MFHCGLLNSVTHHVYGSVHSCVLLYSEVHCVWPVVDLAELVEGPAGFGEVSRCLFAWNCR
jgi:hypothetical protein